MLDLFGPDAYAESQILDIRIVCNGTGLVGAGSIKAVPKQKATLHAIPIRTQPGLAENTSSRIESLLAGPSHSA